MLRDLVHFKHPELVVKLSDFYDHLSEFLLLAHRILSVSSSA